MEVLVQRLEQAVVRLETVSSKLQGFSGSLSNGEINGINGTTMSKHTYTQLQNINVNARPIVYIKCFTKLYLLKTVQNNESYYK